VYLALSLQKGELMVRRLQWLAISYCEHKGVNKCNAIQYAYYT